MHLSISFPSRMAILEINKNKIAKVKKTIAIDHNMDVNTF